MRKNQRKPPPIYDKSFLRILRKLSISIVISAIAIAQAPLPAFSPVKTVAIRNKTIKNRASGPVRILDADHLHIDDRNRFCINASADAASVTAAERSGEYLKSWTIQSFANDAAIALSNALRGARLPAQVPGAPLPDRVLLGSHPRVVAACDNDARTIFISIDIASVAHSSGYRATITARQGAQRYVSQIERTAFINMPMEGRALIGENENTTRDGKPYWDISHDVFQIRKSLFIHLFGE